MDEWTPKLKLFLVLATTKELLLRSANTGWPDERPEEAAQEIDGIISHLLRPKQCPLPQYARVQYAPTGPIQEIAMANGWHDAYMHLSAEFDALAHLIRVRKARGS